MVAGLEFLAHFVQQKLYRDDRIGFLYCRKSIQPRPLKLLFQLDVRTLMGNDVVVCLLLMLVMLLMAAHLRETTGLRYLGVSYLLMSCGMSVFLMRGVVPPVATILIQNGCFYAGIILQLIGTRALLGLRARMGIPIAIAIVSEAALGYFHLPRWLGLRVAIFSCTCLALRMPLLISLVQNMPRGMVVKLLSGFTAFFMLCEVARGVLTLAFGVSGDLFKTNIVQSMYIAVTLVAGCAIGFLSLVLAAQEATSLSELRARRDMLTGALNRLGIEELLAVELSRCKRTQTSMSLALLDIDDFKHFNDKDGHSAGDDVLRKIAGCISRNLRSYDACGRIGGDEFLVLFPASGSVEAELICHRILGAVLELPSSPNVGRAPTVSIGFTEVEEFDTIEELLKRADEALYAAKRLGKNCAQAKLAPIRGQASRATLHVSASV